MNSWTLAKTFTRFRSWFHNCLRCGTMPQLWRDGSLARWQPFESWQRVHDSGAESLGCAVALAAVCMHPPSTQLLPSTAIFQTLQLLRGTSLLSHFNAASPTVVLSYPTSWKLLFVTSSRTTPRLASDCIL